MSSLISCCFGNNSVAETRPLLNGSPDSQFGIASPASSYSVIQPRVNQPNVFISAEPNFQVEIGQVIQSFRRNNIVAQDLNSSIATHLFLFITDSFLKSEKLMQPLINRFITDPHFKQRIFPFIMGPISIFRPGEEDTYRQFWTGKSSALSQNTSEYKEAKTIEENIAPFIRTIRDTLMPNLNELLQNDLASVNDLILQKPHLLEQKQFFFLPRRGISESVGQEKMLAKLSSLFAKKSLVVLSGPELIGKTTLAIEYAKRSTQYSSGIYWLDATNKNTLDESFDHLAIQMGVGKEEAKRKLSQMSNFLLIYDNVTDPSLISPIPSGHTLMIGRILYQPDIQLDNFTNEEAVRYLQSMLSITVAQANSFAAQLSYRPSELVAAVAYIKACKINVEDYMRFYRTDQANLLEKQKKLLEPQNETFVSSPRPIPSYNLAPNPQTIQKLRNQTAVQLSSQLKDHQIFVSYCWKPTKDPVNQMDATFRSLGITLLRDERELRNFDSLKEFMKKVIREADYTISVVNDNYLLSTNCLYEVVTTMEDPHWMMRVFPIVLPGLKLDDQKIISYQEHWRKEAENLERTLGKDSPDATIARDAARKIGPYLRFVNSVQPDSLDENLRTKFQKILLNMLARQEKLEKKGAYRHEIFHLPMERNKEFTGRDKEILLLENSLKSGRYSAITNSGMGGVGKSQLALEYAYRYANQYSMIYWIRSENLEALKADYRLLGQEMRISEEFLTDEKVIPTMKSILESRGGWLLVFDNADNPANINEALPQRGGHVLITSRNQNWDKKININVFSKAESVAYLKKIADLSGEDAELGMLAEELGHLPLALSQAGAYIKRQKISTAEYRLLYKDQQTRLLSQRERGYPGSVATTWLLSMDKIKREDPNAVKLLNFCSYLAPENIPQEVLERWLQQKNKREMGLDFHDALRILENYSLISQKVDYTGGVHKKTISIHRLIQAVTRDEHEKSDVKDSINIGINVLSQQFEGEAVTKELREEGEQVIQHAQHLMSHAEMHSIVDAQAGTLLHKIASFLSDISDLKTAQLYSEKALKIKIASYKTENHPEVAASYNNQGVVFRLQGDLAKAKMMFQKDLDILSKLPDGDHRLSMASSYFNLGGVQRTEQNFTEAERNIYKALQLRLAFYGNENNKDVAKNYIGIALLLNAQGRHKEAKEACNKAIKIYTNLFKGENHVDVAGAYVNLAVICDEQGELTTATDYYQRALKILLDCYKGEDHPHIANIYSNLTLILTQQGNFQKAREYCDKSIKIRTVCYGGERHFSLAGSYNNLGEVLRHEEDYNQAKQAYEKALDILLSYYESENYLEVAAAYHNLGIIYYVQQNFKEAKKFYDKALNIRLECHKGENHANVGESYLNLATLAMMEKDFNLANKLFRKSLNIFITYYGGEHHSNVAACYHNLGMVSGAQGNFKDAITYLDKALKIYTAFYKGENHFDIATINVLLGTTHHANGNESRACECLEKAAGILKSCYGGENHLKIAMIYNDLGDILMAQKNLNKAKVYYEKAINIQIHCLGENATEVVKGYRKLGAHLKAANDFRGAKGCFEKALRIMIAPNSGVANLDIAQVYRSLGDINLSLRLLTDARANYVKAKELYRTVEGNKFDRFFDGKILECN